MNRLGRQALVLLGSSLIVACGSDDETLGQLAPSSGGFPQGGFPMYGSGGAGGFLATGGIIGAGGIIPSGGAFSTGGALATGGAFATGGSSGSGGGGAGGVAGSGGLAGGGSGGTATGGAGGAGGVSSGGAGGGVTGGSAGAGGSTGGTTGDASVPDSATDGASGDGGGVDSSTDGPAPPGCSATFVPITLTGTGTLNGSVQDDTSDGVSKVAPTACDTVSVGDGPDLGYSFTLDRPRDVTLTLTPGFDGMLRTYGAACSSPLNEPGSDACKNANTGTGGEQMFFPNLGAATYYVVVDGKGANDRGAFTLAVKAVCNGTEQVRLVELGIGATDYAVIRNMSDCPAELGGLKVLFDDSVGTDLTTTLPVMTLAPGAQLRIQENLVGSVPGAVDAGGGIPFQFDRGGTVRLCKGACSSATDIIDVLSFADGDASTSEPPPPPPAGLKFQNPVSGITQSNQNTKSWVRVGSGGQKPNFLGSDWCTGEPGAVFGLRLDEVFLGEPDYVAIKNRSDCIVNLSPFRATFVAAGSNPVNAIMDARSVVVGGRVFVSEPPAQSNDINIGVAIQFIGGGAGTVQLCRGACATAGNTIDVIAFDGSVADGGTVPYPALPGGLVFSPNGLTAVTAQNQMTTSYVRSALGGSGLRYVASDWTTGPKTH